MAPIASGCPVLLSEEAEFETWLSGSPDEAFALAKSFDPAAMRIVQSGFEKKDVLAAQEASLSVTEPRFVVSLQTQAQDGG